MASRFFDRLNEFRTSHVGIVIFYGYLVAILVAGVLIGKVVIDNHHLANQARRLSVQNNSVARQNHRVLCAQKNGYELTYRNATTYLRKHPHGTVAFSRDVIVAAKLQAKVQLGAFKDVKCGG